MPTSPATDSINVNSGKSSASHWSNFLPKKKAANMTAISLNDKFE